MNRCVTQDSASKLLLSLNLNDEFVARGHGHHPLIIFVFFLVFISLQIYRNVWTVMHVYGGIMCMLWPQNLWHNSNLPIVDLYPARTSTKLNLLLSNGTQNEKQKQKQKQKLRLSLPLHLLLATPSPPYLDGSFEKLSKRKTSSCAQNANWFSGAFMDNAKKSMYRNRAILNNTSLKSSLYHPPDCFNRNIYWVERCMYRSRNPTFPILGFSFVFSKEVRMVDTAPQYRKLSAMLSRW